MEQVIINYEKMEWTEAEGYPSGTQEKVLLNTPQAKTLILKLPPGFDMEPHSHLWNEQHLVLDGSYISEDKAYDKGAYRFIPTHTNHGPFYSKDGALVLVIWNMPE